ncbi:hypothetical protein FJT64_012849 [Amphibalanus amphitrite]|uniref:Uncharacterized protein n=1 Tax=Amphibalanus amphitrite TaxID=1232801 RepID=A0A6A4V4U2_AMPAM|nr:hypothetical protein FJT64_012849 [Amphibalanus amphitrite]KAF0288763.1 hypothetical protein FJT64_012849 [Amphibalanus amphitrite]
MQQGQLDYFLQSYGAASYELRLPRTTATTNYELRLRLRLPKERDVSTATRDRLLELFRMGYSAEQARDELISAPLEEAGDDFYRVAADHEHCPDVGYCHRLYRTEFKKVYGELSGEKMLDGLRCLGEQYDGTSGGRAALEVDDHNVVVAIVTPLMRRVSQLWPRAAVMWFVDSSGNMDRSDSRLSFSS